MIDTAKLLAWRFIGALVMKPKSEVHAVSMGRLAFMALFCHMMYAWLTWASVDTHQIWVAGLLLAYIAVGKFSPR